MPDGGFSSCTKKKHTLTYCTVEGLEFLSVNLKSIIFIAVVLVFMFRCKGRACKHNHQQDGIQMVKCFFADSASFIPLTAASYIGMQMAFPPKYSGRLAAESIDVCLIQGTKVDEKDASPPFPGYNSTRLDRPSTHRGGGLLTLVKEGMVFQRAAEDYSPPLERLTIQIQLSRRRWATIHNRYVVPVKGPTLPDSLALNNISVGPLTLAAGDLNVHSSLWDEHQPADQRGETVENWLISRLASILSNGEPTHAKPLHHPPTRSMEHKGRKLARFCRCCRHRHSSLPAGTNLPASEYV